MLGLQDWCRNHPSPCIVQTVVAMAFSPFNYLLFKIQCEVNDDERDDDDGMTDDERSLALMEMSMK